eukprot:jgi/Chrzof1/13726/Cz08g09200.t1
MLASAMNSSFVAGQCLNRRALVPTVPRYVFNVEAAHKKGAGSTKNGRDSNSKRRGVKVYGGQEVKAGGIIVRQLGSTWYAGDNVGTGKDYTLFSTIDGIVVYQKKQDRSKINVYPLEHEKAKASVTATHTTQPKDGVPSRKDRRHELYKPRGQEAAAEPAVAV